MMKTTRALIVASAALVLATTTTAGFAQAKEQFFPLLTFRTGPYAPSGAPWANGFVDYFKLVNAKGGINGVRVAWEVIRSDRGDYANHRRVAPTQTDVS